MTDIMNIYATGLVCMSVCAHKETSKEEVEKYINRRNSTGIESNWSIADESFRDGSPNPHECEYNTTRQHWLLTC